MLGYLPQTLSVLKSGIICSENCGLRGTDTCNVRGQISEYIFAPNGGYRVYYPSNLLRNTRSFENCRGGGGYS